MEKEQKIELNEKIKEFIQNIANIIEKNGYRVNIQPSGWDKYNTTPKYVGWDKEIEGTISIFPEETSEGKVFIIMVSILFNKIELMIPFEKLPKEIEINVYNQKSKYKMRYNKDDMRDFEIETKGTSIEIENFHSIDLLKINVTDFLR